VSRSVRVALNMLPALWRVLGRPTGLSVRDEARVRAWASDGTRELEGYLRNHADFEAFCAGRRRRLRSPGPGHSRRASS
jgi:hypothetical protein